MGALPVVVAVRLVPLNPADAPHRRQRRRRTRGNSSWSFCRSQSLSARGTLPGRTTRTRGCPYELVGRRVLEAVLTSSDCSCDSGEAYADTHLLGSHRSRAFHFLTQVNAVTVAAGGLCYTVCAKQHFCTAVLAVLTRFTQCAGYRINTGTPFYFCHFLLTMFRLRPA